jgi:hypothetical protein
LALGAWCVGGVAAAVSAAHAKRIGRFSAPSSDALVARARDAAKDAPPGNEDALALLELELIRDEANRAFAIATLVPRGMARVSLASGTAFALLALAVYMKQGLVLSTGSATIAFLGGAVGAAVAAAFGRRARGLAVSARGDWKRAYIAATKILAPR